MTASVNSFLANFTGSGARPNRYEVIIGFPNFLGLTDTSIQQKISFTCHSTSLPASELGTATVPYKGREIKVPGDRTFQDWECSILIDSDFVGRDVFEKWSAGMLGNTTNLTKSNNEINTLQIFGQAQVNLLDRHDNVIKRYQITGMFPTNIGSIALSYSNNNTVMEQPVTFAINSYEAFDADGVVITN